MDKKKKNTYYFFKFKKKIDMSSISSSGKQSFSVEKKKPLKQTSLIDQKQLQM